MPNPTGFTGVPNRDATASIRGYVYQIYQSVLAWMTLDEVSILVLEGTEDFDVHTESEVVATQVKCESKNVTLRSKAVVDAINNFWTHRLSNSDFRVYLRYLTTATPGCEQGTPFGADMPGLVYWKSVSQNGSDCSSLRQFLLTLPLQSNLLSFIRTSTDDSLRGELLKNIQWDMGARDKEALEAIIENKLKVHGFKKGIGVQHSVRVLPHLLKKVADVLSVDGVKSLCFGDFLTSFEEATTEVIPRAMFEVLQNSGGIQQLISMQNYELTRHSVMPSSLGPMPFS